MHEAIPPLLIRLYSLALDEIQGQLYILTYSLMERVSTSTMP
jgi:hypothetical protein